MQHEAESKRKQLKDLAEISNQKTPAGQAEVSPEMHKVGLEAIKAYHLLIKDADLQCVPNKPDQDLIKRRIELREDTAQCYELIRLYGDAQLYLIGALHIAHNEPKDAAVRQDAKLRITAALARVKEALGQVLPAGKEPDSAPTVVLNSARQAPDDTRSYREDSSLWLSLHTSRADSSVVQYCAAREDITEATDKAHATWAKGVALVSVGAGVPALGVGGVVGLVTLGALSLTPFGWAAMGAIATATLISSAVGGFALIDSGFSRMKEPAIRKRLNKLVEEAVEHFKAGRRRQFLERLSVPISEDAPTRGATADPNPERVLHFTQTGRLSISSEKVAACLLSHGIRPDGVAFILNCVAESITSGGIFDSSTTSSNDDVHLRAQAKDIYYFVDGNQELRDKAYKMDNKILEHSFSGSWSRFFARSWIGKMIYGIPASFFAEHEAAPFTARLEEMRNCARLNCAILEIITAGSHNLENAFSLLQKLQQSPNNNFFYFHMNPHRLDTVADTISAFSIVSTAEPTATQAVKVPSLRLGVKLRAITSSVACSTGPAIPMVEFLGQLGVDIGDEKVFRRRLQEFVKTDRDSRGRMFEVGSYYEDDGPVAFLAERVWRITDHQAAFRKLTTAHLRPEYFSLLEKVFAIAIVRCRCLDEGEHGDYLPIDDFRTAEKNLKRAVFLYSPEYRASDDKPTSRILPTKAFVANPDSVDDTRTSKLFALLFEVQNFKHDYNRAAIEKEKIRILCKIRDCFLRVDPELNPSVTDPDVVEALLGKAECLIMMFHLQEAVDLLNSARVHQLYNEHWKLWYLLAQANRKKREYRAGKAYINRAAEAASWFDFSRCLEGRKDAYALIKRESSYYKRLRDEELREPQDLLQNVEMRFSYELAIVPSVPSVEQHAREYYNVLSLDGGGIKGIIPAMILAEVEKRANVPIAHMFDLIAGTSTGAIIAAGLACPAPTGLPGAPRYTAYKILELYADPAKASKIFEPSGHFWGLFGARYTARGREEILWKHFDPAEFRTALTDLCIVACNQHATGTVVDFNKRENPDMLLSAAALASSAAPTYFPKHAINGVHHIDGGVGANNPSQQAYKEAMVHAGDRRKIRMWSLGCGDHLPDYKPRSDGILGAGETTISQAIRSQQLQADETMVGLLGKQYTRFNLIFEHEHGLDDIKPATLVEYVELTKQFIAEHDEDIARMVKLLTEP